jgi:hypothetical protein
VQRFRQPTRAFVGRTAVAEEAEDARGGGDGDGTGARSAERECVPTLLRFLRRAPVGRTGTSLAPSSPHRSGERGRRWDCRKYRLKMLDYARTRGTFFSTPYLLTHSYPCFLLSLGAPDSHPPALGVTFVPAPLDSRRHPFLVSFVGFLRFRPLALECSARPSVAVWRKCRLTVQDCGILMCGRYTLCTPHSLAQI